MYLFVELWKPKAAWLALSQAERGAYMTQLGPAIQGLLDAGVEIISWSLNDPETDRAADYPYFGVYKFPSKESTKQFEQLVTGAGWYNYFEQINAKGALDNPQSIIGNMIGL